MAGWVESGANYMRIFLVGSGVESKGRMGWDLPALP
jgi:hypothetical protein